MSGKKEKRLLDQQQPNDSNNIISDKERFLNTLFKNLSGFIEIREIKDGKSNQKFFQNVDDLMEYEPPTDKNIYFGVMTRSRKRGRIEDTRKTNVLWFDFDDVASYAEIEYILNMRNLPEPSIIVNSGHGYHLYYLLDKPAGAEIKAVLNKFIKITGADSRAADLARIMRLPDTMNVKEDPVECKLMTISKNKYNLNEIADLLGVEVKEPPEKGQIRPEKVAEVLGIDYKGIKSQIDKPCIKSILDGVPKGERNWLLGRLTRHLKDDLAISKMRAEKVVRVWNLKCEPSQIETEVLSSFNSYWNNDNLNLQGCKILDSTGDLILDKQQILNKYCNKGKCSLTENFELAEIEGESLIKFNNRLLNKIKSMSVYSLIIYGVLSMHEEGLTKRNAAKIIGITKKTFKKHTTQLIKLGFINVRKGIRQRGTSDLYYLRQQGTFNLGRTSISYAAIRLLNAELRQGYIRPAEIKVYMLLRYFEYQSKTGEVYPATTTLAEKLGTSRPRLSYSINRLEERDFIKIDREKRRSNTYIFKVR
jgi:hypothetical protein